MARGRPLGCEGDDTGGVERRRGRTTRERAVPRAPTTRRRAVVTLGPRPGQPDRRAHRLQRRPVPAGRAAPRDVRRRAARDDGRIRLVSGEQRKTWEGTFEDLSRGSATAGRRTSRGVVWALGEAGHDVAGLDVAVDRRVPLGGRAVQLRRAGVPVGTSRCCACSARRLARAAPAPLAAACIRAENEYVGAPTGGMDQTIAMLAAVRTTRCCSTSPDGSAPVPFEPEDAGLALLVIDTRVRHALTDGGYGDRRAECEGRPRALGVELARARRRSAASTDLPTSGSGAGPATWSPRTPGSPRPSGAGRPGLDARSGR